MLVWSVLARHEYGSKMSCYFVSEGASRDETDRKDGFELWKVCNNFMLFTTKFLFRENKDNNCCRLSFVCVDDKIVLWVNKFSTNF